MRTIFFLFLILFSKITFSQSLFLEPNFGARYWLAEDSSHAGVDGGLRFVQSLHPYFHGVEGNYTYFEEKLDDQNLAKTTWQGYSFAAFIGWSFESSFISIGYVPYDKLSTKSTKQYVSQSTVQTFNNLSLTGAGLKASYGVTLFEGTNLSISYKSIRYDEQEHDLVNNEKIDVKIESITLALLFPFTI